MSAATRNKARDDAFTAAETFRIYVFGLAMASPESAVTLAEDAGMKVAATPVRNRAVLGIRQGPHPGIVNLFAYVAVLVTAKGGRFFNWEYSLDGKVWVAAPSTPNGHTTICRPPAAHPVQLPGQRDRHQDRSGALERGGDFPGPLTPPRSRAGDPGRPRGRPGYRPAAPSAPSNLPAVRPSQGIAPSPSAASCWADGARAPAAATASAARRGMLRAVQGVPFPTGPRP